MTSPPRDVVVQCPKCSNRYRDWFRPSLNLDIEDFDAAYVDSASSAVCPRCGTKVSFDNLIVRDGVFRHGPVDGLDRQSLEVNHDQHPVERLFAQLPEVEPYPNGVVVVTGRIPGIAFFPGGSGLWGVEPGRALPPMPIGGVMVLGHDFHSEAAFRRGLAQGSDVPSIPRDGYVVPATWIALRKLLHEVEIPLTQCFFTNAYMGLREGSETMGRFPGARDAAYIRRCQLFLLHQLEAQRPALILTLGAWVPSFIAPLSPQLRHWRAVRSLAVLDMVGPLVPQATFPDAAMPPSTVLSLTHPSLRGPNVRHRRYRDAAGHDAELAMLREAVAISRIKERNA